MKKRADLLLVDKKITDSRSKAQAMEMAGTPCPYKGKIGVDAAKAWAENPEKRPDYEKWLKEHELENVEKEWNNNKKTWGVGLGSLAMLLFLL